jgi:hypothetical protein
MGLIAGGLLTTYASWRWGFVSVPIGIAIALAARRVLGETGRRRGRFDLPGAVTRRGSPRWSTACPTQPPAPNGVSHRADAKVVASRAASVVLLADSGSSSGAAGTPCCRANGLARRADLTGAGQPLTIARRAGTAAVTPVIRTKRWETS